MAEIRNLISLNSLSTEDEFLVRQGEQDKRMSKSLASALAWAVRWDKQFEGVHTAGIIFNSLDSFTFSAGKLYFPKEDTSIPYTSSYSDPSDDINLTTVILNGDSDHTHNVLAMYPVGAVYSTLLDINPTIILRGGEWVLLPPDCCIYLGGGDDYSDLEVNGEDTVVLPQIPHTHTATTTDSIPYSVSGTVSPLAGSSNLKTSPSGGHKHSDGWGYRSNEGFSSSITATGEGGLNAYQYGSGCSKDSNNGSFARTSWDGEHTHSSISSTSHNHTLDFNPHKHTVQSTNVSSEGDNNPTIDIHGKDLVMNMWVRIA